MIKTAAGHKTAPGASIQQACVSGRRLVTSSVLVILFRFRAFFRGVATGGGGVRGSADPQPQVALFQPARRVRETDYRMKAHLRFLRSGKGSLRPVMGPLRRPGMGPPRLRVGSFRRASDRPFRPGKGPLRTGMNSVRHGMDPFRPGNGALRNVMDPLICLGWTLLDQRWTLLDLGWALLGLRWTFLGL